MSLSMQLALMMLNPRITINEPGHAHELTFSCRRRLKLLSDPEACGLFLSNLDNARKKWKFKVWSYVIMPEHVHVLIFPTQPKYSMPAILRDIKRPFAREMLKRMRATQPRLVEKLRNGEKDGKTIYSFWETGPGYDRNLFSPEAIWASIDYIHANPVVRGLCDVETQWEWSSAAFYAGQACHRFDVDPCDVPRPSTR